VCSKCVQPPIKDGRGKGEDKKLNGVLPSATDSGTRRQSLLFLGSTASTQPPPTPPETAPAVKKKPLDAEDPNGWFGPFLGSDRLVCVHGPADKVSRATAETASGD